MTNENTPHKPMDAANTERLVDLASNQVVKRVAAEKDDDMVLPETRLRTEEEKSADVIPEDFESFNLNAATELEQLKEQQDGPPED